MTGRFENTGLPSSMSERILELNDVILSGRDLSSEVCPMEVSPDITGMLKVWKLHGEATPICDAYPKGGTALYLGEYNNHWGHFLAFCMQRLWWAIHGDIEQIDAVVFHVKRAEDAQQSISGNVARIFDVLGITEKVKLVYEPQCFRRVIIPEASVNVDTWRYNTLYGDLIDHIRGHILAGREFHKTRRVFLTRSQLSTSRREIGLRDFDRMFEDNGFDVVAPEKLSLQEMIELFAESREIVSVSGTTAHNLIFADSSSTEMVILERTAINNRVQVSLELACSMNTVRVEASLTARPVIYGGGPFLYSFTEQMLRWMDKERLAMPAGITSEKKVLKQLHRFFKLHDREYQGYDPYEDYELDEASSVAESMVTVDKKYNVNRNRCSLWSRMRRRLHS